MVAVALESLKATIGGLLDSEALKLVPAKAGKRAARDKSKAFGVPEARAFLEELLKQVKDYVRPAAESPLSIIAQALDPRTLSRVAGTYDQRKELYKLLEQVGAVTAAASPPWDATMTEGLIRAFSAHALALLPTVMQLGSVAGAASCPRGCRGGT